MPLIAALDLGTNTFHLLIASVAKDGSFQKIFKERRYTKLGEEGTSRIGDRAYQRGLECLGYFKSIIDQHNVHKTIVLGTAALREASNGGDFIADAKTQCSLDIEIIDGHQEAKFIHRGALAAIPTIDQPLMIMDIGGGSVEFIISERGTIRYLESFKIGLSPLHAVADISDVAKPADVVHLHQYLAGQLSKLYAAINQYKPSVLVGSAGAFEVLVTMTGQSLDSANHYEVDAATLSALYVKILGSSKKEKTDMPGLPIERVDYIAAAMVLIWHIYDSVNPSRVLVSRYALKEGALFNYLD